MSTARGTAPDAGAETTGVPARFQVIGELGRGGMGVVHEVRDERGAILAIKGLRDLRPREILRIKDEFRALRDTQHPNLCRLGELFEDSGRWFYTMELVPGTDILRWVRPDEAARRTPSPVALRPSSLSVEDAQRSTSTVTPSITTEGDDTAALDAPTSTAAPRDLESSELTARDDAARSGAWVDEAPVLPPHQRAAPGHDEPRLRASLRGIALGVAALHRAGLAHRDLKPSNIRVDPTGRVVILDFGVVAAVGRAEAEIVGTPAYMAPEQLRGEASPAVDWYAVGVLLYRMLTGHLPFPATREGLRLRAHRLPPPPDALVRDLPPDLAALAMRLLEPEPSLRGGEVDVLAIVGAAPIAPPAVTADGPWWRTGPGVPFIGRDQEQARLRRLAAATGARATVITGSSGMGKTALVHHVLRALTTDAPTTVVFHGRCDQRELVPFNALDSVVDDLARLLAREPALIAIRPDGWEDLVRLFPVLSTAMPPGDAPERAVDRARAAAALADLLSGVAAVRPLVIFIDDLHWADADSVALLGDLFGGERAPPVLLVATARGDAHAAPAVRALRIPIEDLALRGLEDTDVRALVAAAAPGTVDAAAIARGAGGHPMFVAELARFAAEHRTAAGNLEEALWERARELDPAVRRLLSAVVVAGAPIDLDAAADAAGVAPSAAAAAVDELRGQRLVRSSRKDDRDIVEPYHDRVAAAVTSHLGDGERGALHRSLADALAARGAPPEPLAYHLAAAGDRAAAAVHAARAATRAAATFAFERAAEWYAMALDGDPATIDRQALAVARAEMLIRAGRPRDAATAFLAAAGDETEPTAAMDLRRRAFEQFFMGGYLAEGVAIAREVLAALDLELPRSRRRIIAGLLWNRWRTDRTGLAWTPTPAEQLPARERLRLDAAWSATAGFSLVDAVLGTAYSAKLSRLCLAAGEPMRIARALASEAFTTAVSHEDARLTRIETAIAQTDTATSVPEVAIYRLIASTARAWFFDNDWTATTRLAESAIAAWQSTGGGLGWEVDILEMFVAWAQAARGELSALGRHVQAAVRQARRSGNRLREVIVRVSFPQVHLALDRPDEAEADVADAFASWHVPDGLATDDNAFFWSVKSRTIIAQYRGPDPALDAALEAAWARVERSLLVRFPVVHLETGATRGHWRVGRAVADPRAAPALLSAAAADVRRMRKSGMPAARVQATLLEAGIAQARGDADGAIRLLTALLPALDRHVMPGPAAAARRQLGGLLGGQQGRQLQEQADQALTELGATRPERIVRLWTSGW
jgi:hypothetical protein